ncbi:hypothetical protein C8258_19440 [Nocardia sp. MDA0666]|nr:maleylpyruvate isomerase N-terminal domain-containing protein [Nocardia sp. MDA0666]PSR66699.1 hypothetical protein C8258_19440 [Nocardia sp. MDA0666]
MALTFERYCDEIVAQTELLRAALAHADTAVPVPSCPGWTVGQLGRHLGGAQRWARAAVAGRSRPPRSRFWATGHCSTSGSTGSASDECRARNARNASPQLTSRGSGQGILSGRVAPAEAAARRARAARADQIGDEGDHRLADRQHIGSDRAEITRKRGEHGSAFPGA